LKASHGVTLHTNRKFAQLIAARAIPGNADPSTTLTPPIPANFKKSRLSISFAINLSPKPV
jgi:hypothetical protein